MLYFSYAVFKSKERVSDDQEVVLYEVRESGWNNKIQCEWREPEVLLIAICEVDDVIKDYELQETEFIAMFQNQFCIWTRDICDN